jgi:uncharacterized cupin superfamily protein
MLGFAGGSEKLYVNIDVVAPGAKSCKPHSHSHQEEFFLVLKGSGSLRLGDATHKVQQGDFFSKPAGTGIVHQFINDGNQPLEILDVGIPHPDDVVDYPDEKVQLIKATRKFLRDGVALEGWTSDPNS